MSFERYGIYYLPSGEWAQFGARWLGWDVVGARDIALPAAQAHWVARPQKYGFHATLKAPFYLAEGRGAAELSREVAAVAARHAPFALQGVELARMGSFYALVPAAPSEPLARLAGECVTALDGFRAPPSDAELERRRARRLSPVQDEMLRRWGYPYVLEAFRFHITLTGRIAKGERAGVEAALAAQMPALDAPFPIAEIALVGAGVSGKFEQIERFPLG
ncbi:DUF1045 domain-containing protein [Roseobacteraceae bacterium S113]